MGQCVLKMADLQFESLLLNEIERIAQNIDENTGNVTFSEVLIII